MCAWQRRACLALCGLCCAAAGTPGLLHSQAARGWLALRLLASPRPPCPFAPPRRLCNRGGAQAPYALRPVADVRMPVHATIIRGRRHLRVALEIEIKKAMMNI